MSIKKKLFIVAGSLSLLLGSVGIVVPLLPTTPFLLLSAACFLRGSDRIYNWLTSHPLFGEYVNNYIKHRAIPMRSKVLAISMLWIFIFIAILFFAPYLWLRILLAIIAIAVTLYIRSLNTTDRFTNP